MPGHAHDRSPSSAALARGRLLLAQRRPREAEEQLRLALSGDPEDADGHALLAAALLAQERLAEATTEAERAVALEPDDPRNHRVLGLTLLHRNRFAEARAAAGRATELDPQDADAWGLRSAAAQATQDWDVALAYADEGLAADPEHGDCRNLRANALRNLGRHDEAAATIEGALQRDPDDPGAHTAAGWAALHRGGGRAGADAALMHFREALRLDPTDENARAGTVEALKARHRLYRLMLRFFLWMASLKPGTRWMIVIGGFVGARLVRSAAGANPALGWVLWPLLVLYVAFVWLTWLAVPLFNLLLRASKFGRHALTDDQRRGSTLVGLCVLAMAAGAATAVGAFVAAVVTGDPERWAGLMVVGGATLVVSAVVAIPASTVFFADAGPRRWAMAAVAGVCALAGLAGVAAFAYAAFTVGTDAPMPAAADATIGVASPVLFWGVLGSQLLANVLATRPRRL